MKQILCLGADGSTLGAGFSTGVTPKLSLHYKTIIVRSLIKIKVKKKQDQAANLIILTFKTFCTGYIYFTLLQWGQP